MHYENEQKYQVSAIFQEGSLCILPHLWNANHPDDVQIYLSFQATVIISISTECEYRIKTNPNKTLPQKEFDNNIRRFVNHFVFWYDKARLSL